MMVSAFWRELSVRLMCFICCMIIGDVLYFVNYPFNLNYKRNVIKLVKIFVKVHQINNKVFDLYFDERQSFYYKYGDFYF